MKRIMFIGTGKLPGSCAQICLNKYKVEIYEYGASRMSTLDRWCKKNDIYYESVNKDQLYDRLKDIDEETLIVSANSTYIIPADIIRKKEITAINFHPALLPKHPGRNAEAWTIYDCDEVGGITWHIIDEHIDHGRIIAQETIELSDKITSLGLMMLQFGLAANAFSGFIDLLMEKGVDSLNPKENTTKSSDIHYSSDIPNDGRLDGRWNSKKISSFLRAMDYGPLNVLGKPYCYIDEEKYVWDSYEISENCGETGSDPVNGLFSDDKYSIRLKGWRKM